MFLFLNVVSVLLPTINALSNEFCHCFSPVVIYEAISLNLCDTFNNLSAIFVILGLVDFQYVSDETPASCFSFEALPIILSISKSLLFISLMAPLIDAIYR